MSEELQNTQNTQDFFLKPINVEDELKDSFLDYSMSVIVARALPDVRDGLKPSQRRILYAMHELSLYPPKKHMKCAKICGDTSGNYHPHGESVIYPTLVNMGQNWGIREPLVDPQGNFGSVEGDPPAAMRYTEARLSPLGGTLMDDMDKDTVDFVPNYDERLTEPVVFPAAFPQLLVNGGTGIAVGMATNMPPHNLSEVVDGVCAQIDNPNITIRELMNYIQGPDFPTGCTILGRDGILNYFETGRGSTRIRGHAEITDNGNREQIIISAIPYGVNRAHLVERIAELHHEKILPEISAVRDESDENTRVVIDLKRDARAQVVLNNLYKHTSLETSFSVNMLAIDNRRPKVLNLKDAISCYIEHRREVVLRRTRYLLRKAEERAEKLEAFLLAIGHLDDFIDIIRSSSNREEAFERLKAYQFTTETAVRLGILIRSQPSIINSQYCFTDVQVNHILELRLYQLTGLERDKVKNEYDHVLAEIQDFLDIIKNEHRVLSIIKTELLAIKAKHGTDRLTLIKADEGEIRYVDLIPNKPMIVTLTHRGFIKRTDPVEYRLQSRGGKGLKGMETRAAKKDDEEDDFVEHLFTASAHDYLMFFTNTGRAYAERVYQIPEESRIGKGRSIKNLLNLRPTATREIKTLVEGKEIIETRQIPAEKITAVLRLEATGAGDESMFSEDKFLFFATEDGTVKRTEMAAFKNIRKTGINAINLDEGNDLVGVAITDGSKKITLITQQGLCIRFEEEDVRPIGRAAAGVTGARLNEGDKIMSLAIEDSSAMLLVVSEKGMGKRTPFDEYRLINRGGKGVVTMNITERTGNVLSGLCVHETDELMLMTSKGKSVRIRVSEIGEKGRNTQGVKLMDLPEGEFLQDVAIVIADEDETSDTVDSTDQESPTPEDTPAQE
jgi:DNA gyrase subunit A